MQITDTDSVQFLDILQDANELKTYRGGARQPTLGGCPGFL